MAEENEAFKISYKWDELSEEERGRLRRVLPQGLSIRLAAYSDLCIYGTYGQSVLIVTDKEFLVEEKNRVLKSVELSDVAAVYYGDFVGNGVLGVTTRNEERIELVRYSRTLSESFEALCGELNSDLGVKRSKAEEQKDELAKIAGAKEEREAYRCPKCGHPLQYPTDPCPFCTSKRKILGRLGGYLAGHKRLVLIGLLTSIAVVAVNLSPPLLVRLLIDKVLHKPDLPQDVRLNRVSILVGAFFALIVFRFIVQHIRIKTMGQLAATVVMDLRRDLFRSLQRLSLSYYDNEHTGRIMSRVLSDTRHVQQFVVQGMQRMAVQLLMVIGIPLIMFLEHWKLALIALAPIPIAALMGKIFSERYKTVFRVLKRRFASLSAAVSDTVSGIRVVKSFTSEDREMKAFDVKTRDIYDAHMAAAGTRALFNPSVLFIMTMGTIVVWLVGGRWVILGVGALTTGMLIQFISYMNQLYNPVQQLIQLAEVLQQSATSAERVFSIMDMPSDVGDRKDARELTDIQGKVEVQDVSFRYGDGKKVLKNVDFTIEPGEMIGLVGETGSGKSTLVSLICRFYDPTEGSILLDGVDLRNIRVKSLRSNIGMVLQSTYLFAGTIRNNIAYGRPEASEREIIAATRAANAHDFIMNLPDGYDSEVGEQGRGLSGGEKQRIAIARAILKDPPILILDEATSAVDTATEQAIQEAMDRLVSGRTTIAIAHRLSTLRNAKTLYVLEDGEVIERGSHEELMVSNGKYASLCRIQAEFSEHLEVT
ncbi:MAG: ABC transporter transmembrane domain-containing protein [Verrucomicrobiota bacterium]